MQITDKKEKKLCSIMLRSMIYKYIRVCLRPAVLKYAEIVLFHFKIMSSLEKNKMVASMTFVSSVVVSPPCIRCLLHHSHKRRSLQTPAGNQTTISNHDSKPPYARRLPLLGSSYRTRRRPVPWDWEKKGKRWENAWKWAEAESGANKGNRNLCNSSLYATWH